MVDKQKIKRDYAYKCECGRLIEIDDEHKDFFFGHDEENKVSLLEIECRDCPKPGTSCILRREDMGKTVLPLYKGKFKVRWGDD